MAHVEYEGVMKDERKGEESSSEEESSSSSSKNPALFAEEDAPHTIFFKELVRMDQTTWMGQILTTNDEQ